MQEICTASQTERQEKMEKLSNPQKTIEVIKKYDFAFQKKFGQNFLIDAHVLNKIIASADITKDDCVLEIGPGIGTMTQYLAEAAGKVVAVEIDRNLIPILSETLADYENVTVINEDVLKLDIAKLADEYNQGRPIKVVANLPYYITTPIIMKLLEDGVEADSMTVMMQKEVADRMRAHPGTKAYGALSVAVQYYCEAEQVVNVPASCFVPQPKVDSAVLRLDMRTEPPVVLEDQDMFFRCVKAGFGQRRKTLSNALMGVEHMTKEIAGASLAGAGIEPARRAETLDLAEFARLANEAAKRLANGQRG